MDKIKMWHFPVRVVATWKPTIKKLAETEFGSVKAYIMQLIGEDLRKRGLIK